MKHRVIAFLLLVSLLLPLLSGCGDGATTEEINQTSDAKGSYGVETTTDDGFVDDKIPDDVNYGGETVNLLCWDDATMPEFEVESATGENVVEDAIYYRNQEVENRLGVDLNFIMTPGSSTRVQEYTAKVEQAASGNTGEYDILASYSGSITSCVMGGYAYDLLSFPVIDFSAPWWSQDLVAASTVNGRMYFASGDISTNLIYMMNLTFFNSTMVADLSLDNPYELVDKDEWFFSRMFEMSSSLYEDLNQNATKDLGDKFGVVLHKINIDAVFYGYGLSITETKDGVPVFTEDFLGTPTRDFVVMMIDNFKNSNDCIYADDNQTRHVFGRNSALFIIDSPFSVPLIFDSYPDCTYGIVPVPKRDEYQENYRTGMRFTYTPYTIFAGSPNPERAATVLECMASESYRKVTPAVFEITMKYQYALDDVAARMFDIVRDNIVYDFGRSYASFLASKPFSIYKSCIDSKDTDWMTVVSRMTRLMEISLTKVINTLETLYGESK